MSILDSYSSAGYSDQDSGSSAQVSSTSPNSKSHYLYSICSVMYGPDNWPLIIMFIFYSLLAVVLFLLFSNELTLKHIRNQFTKIASLGCLSVYVFYRAVLYSIPIPFGYFTSTFLCNQFPRVIMFSAWHFLGIFFLNAFLFPSASQLCLNVFYSILMLLLVIILLTSIIFSVLQSYPDLFGSSDYTDTEHFDQYPSAANTVYYGFLSIWVTAYTFRILHILRTSSLPPPLRKALIQFAILFTFFTIIWWFRSIWAFTLAVGYEGYQPFAVECVDSVEADSSDDDLQTMNSWFEYEFLLVLRDVLCYYCQPSILPSSTHSNLTYLSLSLSLSPA